MNVERFIRLWKLELDEIFDSFPTAKENAGAFATPSTSMTQ